MPHEPKKSPTVGAAAQQRGVSVTPGLQALIDQINANQQQVQVADEDDDSGPFGIGKAFRAGSNFVAARFRDVGEGVGYAFKALALTNEYIAKPYLGFAMSIGEEIEGKGPGLKGFDVNHYRRRWEKAPLPGAVKFLAEMAADPLVYVGIGAWKTPTIKLAERLSAGVEAGGGLSRANFLQRSLTATRAEWGFSKKSRGLIEALSRGQVLDKKQFGLIVDDAVKTGVIPKSQAATVLENLSAGRFLDFSALRPGWMARLTSPTRLARVFGPMDVLAEQMWRIPFRGLGMVLKPVAGPTGRLGTAAIDRLGQGFPIRQFTWFGSRVGPAVFHDVHEAAKAGKLMTWALQRTDQAVELEAARTVSRVSQGLDQAAAATGLDPYEVMLRLRLEDQALAHKLAVPGEKVTDVLARTMDDDALDALYGGLRRLSDEDFIKLTAANTDEVLRAGLIQQTKNWLGEALLGPKLVEKVAPEDLTMFNRFWGWTEGLVNKWRPVVTSLNPSFQFLNVLSDLTERGGSGLVLRGNSDLLNSLIKHGAPEDLVSGVDNGLGEIALKAFKGDKDAIQGLSQFGIRVNETDPGWFRAMKAATTRADHGAQAGILHRETGNGWLEMLATADVDDPVIRARQFLEELDRSGLNPRIVEELKEALPLMVRSPRRASQKLAEAFSYQNITKEHLTSGEAFRSMVPEWQGEWGKAFDRSVAEGWDPITAAGRASDHADTVIPRHAGTAYRQALSDIAHVEKVKDGMYRDAGIKGLRGVRKANQAAMRETMQGYAEAVRRLDPAKADEFLSRRIPSITLAARQVDAMVETSIALAARERGLPGMMVLPVVEGWNQRVTGKIARNLDIVADALPKYRKAMQAGNMDLAARHLRTMSKGHGDFAQFLEAAEKPLPEMVEEQFRVTGERIWSEYLGRKYEVADGLIALMDGGAVTPKEVHSLLNKAESEVFARGNIPALREKWSRLVARWSGNADVRMPVNTRMTQEELLMARRRLQTELQNRVPFGTTLEEQAARDPAVAELIAQEAQITEQYTTLRTLRRDVEEELGRVRARIHELRFQEQHLTSIPTQARPGPDELTELRGKEADLLARLADPARLAPERPVSEFYLDLQNNYDKLGTAAIESVRRLLPDQYGAFLLEQSGRVRAESIKLAANTAQDQKGAALAQEMIQRFGTMLSRDKQLQLRASQLYREALLTRGLPVTRQRMVDYTNQTNLHKTISSFLPFAAFQLHLPGYLARTFMERPGVIAAMNHFAQEAQKNHGVTGGVLFGQGFVFAPQLRFSYLPILAGNNFVQEGDHPLNQVNDMLSAFGFSPGPNVQVMSEIGNRFADQLGLGQAAPEFRGGLLPQWRFIQDVTALAGIDGGQGLSVPFLGPSADVREREVRRVLAGRLSQRIEQFKREHGRAPYQDEVTNLREFVWQNELRAARQEVAMRDLPAFLLPGVRAHDPEYLRVRERAAFWMQVHGFEGATPRNVASHYRKLNKLQKTNLLAQVPEFADVLAIPPFQESGQDKRVRLARESFFKTRDRVLAATAAEQRKLDAGLEAGTLSPLQYRAAREDLRTKMSGALDSLENNPDYKPFMARERVAPSDPAEKAYMDYLKLEPQDLNQNGVIDDEDMKTFFKARRQYVADQPSWVKDYIRQRQEVQMTPTEIEFTRAQSTLNDFFDIPKYLGLSLEESELADQVLKQVDALVRAQPGRADRLQTLLSLPGLDPQARLAALKALRAPRNPERWRFWQRHRELEMFYPDLRPAEPFTG